MEAGCGALKWKTVLARWEILGVLIFSYECFGGKGIWQFGLTRYFEACVRLGINQLSSVRFKRGIFALLKLRFRISQFRVRL